MAHCKNIFLSDDDADDRLFFKSAFDAVCPGHKLSLFENNCELLDKLRQQDAAIPDIIFIDLNMPSLNGLECLRLIRDLPHLQNVPTIIYSTVQSELFVEEVHELGAAYFIRKPYDFYELTNLIKYVVDLDLDPQSGQTPFDDFVLSFNRIKKPSLQKVK